MKTEGEILKAAAFFSMVSDLNSLVYPTLKETDTNKYACNVYLHAQGCSYYSASGLKGEKVIKCNP